MGLIDPWGEDTQNMLTADLNEQNTNARGGKGEEGRGKGWPHRVVEAGRVQKGQKWLYLVEKRCAAVIFCSKGALVGREWLGTDQRSSRKQKQKL